MERAKSCNDSIHFQYNGYHLHKNPVAEKPVPCLYRRPFLWRQAIWGPSQLAMTPNPSFTSSPDNSSETPLMFKKNTVKRPAAKFVSC
jgi:hypothetical protein